MAKLRLVHFTMANFNKY